MGTPTYYECYIMRRALEGLAKHGKEIAAMEAQGHILMLEKREMAAELIVKEGIIDLQAAELLHVRPEFAEQANKVKESEGKFSKPLTVFATKGAAPGHVISRLLVALEAVFALVTGKRHKDEKISCSMEHPTAMERGERIWFLHDVPLWFKCMKNHIFSRRRLVKSRQKKPVKEKGTVSTKNPAPTSSLPAPNHTLTMKGNRPANMLSSSVENSTKTVLRSYGGGQDASTASTFLRISRMLSIYVPVKNALFTKIVGSKVLKRTQTNERQKMRENLKDALLKGLIFAKNSEIEQKDDLDLVQSNSTYYNFGYLIFITKEEINCEICLDSLTAPKSELPSEFYAAHITKLWSKGFLRIWLRNLLKRNHEINEIGAF
ncbi:hypothetical protein GHT06_020403 [Daphnia sinensis]|uniref:Uncharacterized protein n=1 Tax=Daphnia sinensis TaxID=1820382 RepID=A0AAD5KY09_9CRUS|nr:hypothetical protein GHT06_020403 [Daphnia sinensis]